MVGSTMWAACKTDGGTDISDLDLNRCVGNTGGNLIIKTKYGRLPAFLTRRLSSYTLPAAILV